MTTPFVQDEDEEELLLVNDPEEDEVELDAILDDTEVSLEEVTELEEEENSGHKLQTFDPNAEDDIYASGAYFDE